MKGPVEIKPLGHCRRCLAANTQGAVLVEAAIALPVLIMLLFGMVTYGAWFMAAHSLQQAANDAARAALVGIDTAERESLVDRSIANSVIATGTLDDDLVTVTTSQEDRFFTVSLRYEAARSGLLSHALVPLPANTIRRSAVVQLSSP